MLQTKFDVNNTAKSILYEYKLTDTVADDATAEYMQSYMEKTYSVRSPTISILRILYRRLPEPATLSDTVVWTKTADRSTT